MAIVADSSDGGFVDRKYNSPNRVAADITAILALTPLYPGEVVLAQDTGARYRGLEVVLGRWGQIFVEM